MGRPIQKKWFGEAAKPGKQIIVTGAKFKDGTTATNAYILSQTGTYAYMVQDTAKAHAPEILFLVNANGTGALMPGQCYINATPFGGSALPAKKIGQYRITLYSVPNSVATPTGVPSVSPVANYTWSTVPATKAGQVDLITDTGGSGIVNAVALGVGGAGYFTAPTVSFPPGAGGGTGATATATINASGAVTGYTLLTPGYGYTAGSLIVGAPPTSVTATGTAAATAGVINSVTITNGGGFYLAAPTVTFGGGGTGASATAVISGGRVTGITGLVGGTGYTTPTVTFGAPPAAVQATGTFTTTTSALSEEPSSEAASGDEKAPSADEKAPTVYEKAPEAPTARRVSKEEAPKGNNR